MQFVITSSKNEKFKHFKALKTKKARDEYNCFTVEGKKSVSDAINAGAQINAILTSRSFYNENTFLFPENIDLYIFSDEIFSSLSDTKTPQGIIAVLEKNTKKYDLDTKKAYIYCDHIQDPGNLGTIIRTADAAGFGGVLISDDSVELYNPKTVRSSMGSFFHIEKFEGFGIDDIKKAKNLGFSLVCGVLSENSVDYTAVDYKKPTIIVVGNEANGICDEVLLLSDSDVIIPIDGDAESLNAGVAAAILMYEARRQRQ